MRPRLNIGVDGTLEILFVSYCTDIYGYSLDGGGLFAVRP